MLAFGGEPSVVRYLKDAGVFVLVMVGTPARARDALQWGADGLIAQGFEAGGHLSGEETAMTVSARQAVDELAGR